MFLFQVTFFSFFLCLFSFFLFFIIPEYKQKVLYSSFVMLALIKKKKKEKKIYKRKEKRKRNVSLVFLLLRKTCFVPFLKYPNFARICPLLNFYARTYIKLPLEKKHALKSIYVRFLFFN